MISSESSMQVACHYIGNIPVVEDASWDMPVEHEQMLHRIHAYPAKFPAFITTKAIEYARQCGVHIGKMADVFCGCGTSAFEARRNSIDFWGSDINPVATLIARTKSHSYKTDKLEEYFAAIARAYKPKSITKTELRNVNPRLRYWHTDTKLRHLLALKKAILITVPPQSHDYRDFFSCVFSNILKATSRWLTKSIKPQRDPKKKPVDAWKRFEKQFQFMLKAVKESPAANNSSEIHTLNFLEFKTSRPFVDLVVTSPPYVTSYDYAGIHQLSLLWLDYTNDYRVLRRGTIGSVCHRKSSLDSYKLDISKQAKSIVAALYNASSNKAASVAKYFTDIRKGVFNCHRILRPEGMALFVIGNTEYKGILVDNTENLVKSMQDVGFEAIKVVRRRISRKNLTPFRDAQGCFSADSKSRHVYAEEFIVTGRKVA